MVPIRDNFFCDEKSSFICADFVMTGNFSRYKPSASTLQDLPDKLLACRAMKSRLLLPEPQVAQQNNHAHLNSLSCL